MSNTCRTCVHFGLARSDSHPENQQDSECRRNPPTLLIGGHFGAWPWVSPDAWCGEYRGPEFVPDHQAAREALERDQVDEDTPKIGRILVVKNPVAKYGNKKMRQEELEKAHKS